MAKKSDGHKSHRNAERLEHMQAHLDLLESRLDAVTDAIRVIVVALEGDPAHAPVRLDELAGAGRQAHEALLTAKG
jgi:hypothetical protein